tara:strand:- start:38047 stop:39126 length:1080 start_codon:yes stop_codon:yes gene_type:complete
MIKTIYPLKDTTLYALTASMNSGIDEILDIQKEVSASGANNHETSRILLQFDTSTISSSLSTRSIHTGSALGSLKYYLKMFIAEEKSVPLDYTLSVHPVRESWEMGVGRRYNVPSTKEGASWTYRDGETVATAWTDAGGYFHTGSHTSESTHQIFSNVQGDIDIDVTNIIESFHNGTLTNNGIIVKRSGSQESDGVDYGTLSYYSKETNTIYPPRLEARYDDTPTVVTSSMTAISSNDDVKLTAQLLPEYTWKSETRIEIIAEPRFPTRSQNTAVSSTTVYNLPVSSSYSIKDVTTGETVIDYDSTGTLLAINNKHYIDVDTTSLFPERYYTIQIKVPDLIFTNSVQYFDIPTKFKVVR